MGSHQLAGRSAPAGVARMTRGRSVLAFASAAISAARRPTFFATAFAAVLGVAFAGLVGAPASAQQRDVLIVGDSFGNDYHSALVRQGRGQGWRFHRRSRVSSGLTRDDFYDWNGLIGGIVGERAYSAVVASFGANDGQTLSAADGRHEMGSEGWVRHYEARVSEMMASLRAAGAPVYWIGMPIARSARMTRKYALMNEIYQRQADCHGVAFVDTWERFAIDGAYAAYGPGPNGRRTRLRKQDGIHLTGPATEIVAAEVLEAMDAAYAAQAAASAPVLRVAADGAGHPGFVNTVSAPGCR